MKLIASVVSALVLTGCAHSAPQEITLTPLWTLDNLANPESAALSADRSFLFVSNVNGEGDVKDGNGFISRVSSDGRLLEREWATGLNGPKGVALHNGLLYVSDIDRVVVIDASSGTAVREVEIPGARFLNDLTVLRDGLVLVSDSRIGRISAIRDGAVETWLEDPLLRSINGLQPERDRLVITTMQGRLLAADYTTRAVAVLAEGLGNADGVAPVGHGRYLVSEWPGLMHVVNADGTRTTVLDTRQTPLFMNDFLRVGDELYVPNWQPGSMTAYRIGGAQ
jgi:glucose/arabinose dehydrogenase